MLEGKRALGVDSQALPHQGGLEQVLERKDAHASTALSGPR